MAIGCNCAQAGPLMGRGPINRAAMSRGVWGGLGITPADATAALQVPGQLATATNNLQALQSQYAANPTAYTPDVAAGLASLANRLADITNVFGASYQNAPPNTALGYVGRGHMRGAVRPFMHGMGRGLGQVATIVWAVVIGFGVAAGVILAAIAEWNQHYAALAQEMQAQASLIAMENIGTAQAQLAAGTITQDQYNAIVSEGGAALAASASAAPFSLTTWLSTNWMWVAAAGAAVLIVKDL